MWESIQNTSPMDDVGIKNVSSIKYAILLVPGIEYAKRDARNPSNQTGTSG